MRAGIESYNEGLEPIKSFMRWDKELPQCIRKLRSQHVHFAQTIRILLEPITSDVELAEMMLNPGSAQLWKDEYMVSKLQERLQESYHAYQGTIADIERITKQIASKLDLDRAKEVRTSHFVAQLERQSSLAHYRVPVLAYANIPVANSKRPRGSSSGQP